MTHNESDAKHATGGADASPRRCPFVIRDHCLRHGAQPSDCTRCADICPANAISFTPADKPDDIAGEPGDVLPAIDETACLACDLCSSVCPTEAISFTGLPLHTLRDRIERTAEHYSTVYLTCAKTKASHFSGAMVEVPCLGSVPSAIWFFCLATLEGISVYLPLDMCEGCTLACGEALMMDRIAQAEKWSRTAMGLVTDKEDLDFYVITSRNEQVDRRNFLTSLPDALSDSVRKTHAADTGGLFADRSETAERIKTAQAAARRERAARFAEAHETGVLRTRPRTMTVGRRIMADVLKDHPELASSVRLTISRTGDGCDICKTCMTACPMQARRIQRMKLYTDPMYCIGCGRCADVCPKDAITLVRIDGKVLLEAD